MARLAMPTKTTMYSAIRKQAAPPFSEDDVIDNAKAAAAEPHTFLGLELS